MQIKCIRVWGENDRLGLAPKRKKTRIGSVGLYIAGETIIDQQSQDYPLD